MTKILSISLLFLLFFTVSCEDNSKTVKRDLNGSEITCPEDLYDARTTIQCRVASVTNRSQTTPAGAKLWIENGASISDADKLAIDQGIQRTIDKARCRGYGIDGGSALIHSDYIVTILQSEITPANNVAYRQPCSNYCNTEWDMGGYIYVAGQLASAGLPYGNIIVLPASQGKTEQLSNGAEYEVEHAVLAWYDGVLYTASEFHGNGISHPIWSCTQNFVKKNGDVSPKAPNVVDGSEPRIVK